MLIVISSSLSTSKIVRTKMLRWRDFSGKIVESETTDKSLWKVLDTHNFLTPNEVVEDLFNVWSDNSKKEFLAVGFDHLISLHHGFGMAVRNTYGLWHPKYPGVIEGDLGDGHPDGISMIIIEALYKRIEAQHGAYDAAMSIVQEKK
jgi:hypothetical protein